MREIIKVLRKLDQYGHFTTDFDKILLKFTLNMCSMSIGRPSEEMMSFELKQKIPDPELLLTLEPEELAGVLLPILKKQAGKDGTVSGYNFANNFRQMQEI